MYMSTKEACIKWNISERRIRQLLQDGRIDGAVKVGNSWNIPFDAVKPSDKRFNVIDNNFIINLDESYFDKVDSLKRLLDSKRPLPKATLFSPLLAQDYAKVTLVDIRYIQIDVLDRFLNFSGQDVLMLYSIPVLNNSQTIK